MIRARGGVTSYVGYGALTLIIMYILFLYNATKNGLNTCESNNTNLKDEKRELLSQLSGNTNIYSCNYILLLKIICI